MSIDRIFDNMPDRIKVLPRNDRGFPIPYFAAEIDGKRDFRIVSPDKMAHAVRNDLCWVCGVRLGKYKAFVIGPMCGINRTIADPPSHRECAIFSALNCPFLSSPLAKRRASDMPEGAGDAAGFALKRNPGVTGVWLTHSYRPFRPHAGKKGILFSIGEPLEVLWFAAGRPATRDEVQRSVETGLPAIEEIGRVDGEAGVAELERRVAAFQHLLPAGSPTDL
ncbi:hypothetical protein B5P46_11750 [Rhizobium leguminosarum]|uniref:Uncharacterized protein n=1 Tax=Rhizobium leguminosarum TaxID=384 RepID=A0A4Q1UBG9_RHILE|nr:hypothetical protein [Rhizobium leguminosarum]RXT29349.1 hypothetical protein B5P46_11750 [Rhizobium leguminosarum]